MAQLVATVQAQQNQMRTAFDSASAAIILLDAAGYCHTINSFGAQMFGFPAASYAQRRLTDLLAPDVASDPPLQALLAQQPLQPQRTEQCFLTATGNLCWADLSMTPLVGAGNFEVLVIAVNITQRKQREQRLRMLEAVVLNLSDGVIIIDAHGNERQRPLLFANRAFCQMTGYAEAEIDGLTPELLKGPRTDSGLIFQLLQSAQRGEHDRIEVICYRKDGSDFWSVIDVIPVTDSEGQPDYYVLVLRDVSRRKQAEAELRDSEEKYRLLFENSMDAIVITNTDGQVVQTNQAASNLLGYSREQLSHMGAADIVGVPLERLLCYLEKAYTQGYLIGELDIRRPIGDTRITEYVLCQISPHLHMTILRDITERKLAEVELRAAYDGMEMRVEQRTIELVQLNQALEAEIRERQHSEERYRTLVETSPSAILVTDLAGVIRFCNQRAAALFGYQQVEDLYGLNGSTLVDASTAHHASVRMILEPQQSRNIEYMMVRKNGERFYAEASSSVVTAPNGKPTSLIIVVQDISERKHGEAALTAAYNDVAALNRHLNDSRSLLQALFDGLEDGLLLLDQQGQIQVINRTLAALLDLTAEQVLGQSWASVYQQAAPDFPGQLALEAATIGRQQSQQHRYHSPTFGTRMLDIQVIALGKDEQVEQTILHVIDSTDTVRLQEQVIRAEHFAASGRLAASVAHEINTPLQTIQTNLKLLQRTLGPAHQAFMTDALDEIHRVGRIVRQLLDFYRPAATKRGPVELGGLLERIVLLLGKRIRDQRILIERQIAPDLPPVYGRADELTQIMLNLVINALDVMPHGGSLHLAIDQSDDQSQIVTVIRDSGPGVPPELHEQIFDPFVTTKANGTGLGLSISRQIAEQHGGTIRLISTLGQGSAFVVTLPIGATIIAE